MWKAAWYFYGLMQTVMVMLALHIIGSGDYIVLVIPFMCSIAIHLVFTGEMIVHIPIEPLGDHS